MSCNCHNQIIKDFEEKFNISRQPQGLKAETVFFENQTIAGDVPFVLPVKVVYRKKEWKRPKAHVVNIVPTFCSFCGERYVPEATANVSDHK